MIKSYSYYFVGVLMGRVASIILLPIYTSYLTTSDYGVLEILSMMLVLASIIFGDRVGQAFFREWGCAKKEREKRIAYGSALALSMTLSGTGTILLISGADYLSKWQFGDDGFTFLVAIFSVNLFLNVTRESSLSCLRAMDKAGLYLFFSSLLLVLQIGLNLLVLVKLEYGLKGVVFASVISAALVSVLSNIYVWVKVKPIFIISKMKAMIGYSWPIITAGIFMYIVVYGDRYFLRIYHGLSLVGVYSLGYKFGFILFSMIWSPFIKAWDTEKYRIYNVKEHHVYYKDIFRFMYLVIMSCGLGMVFWVDDFLYYFSSPDFHDAYQIVPVIVSAYVVFALTDFITFGILLSGHTIHFGFVAMASAILSIVLYWWLIPVYGMSGGALATFVVFLFRYLYLRRISIDKFNMRLDEKRMIVDIIILVFIGVGYLLGREGSQASDVLNSFLYSILLIGVFVVRGYDSIIKVIEYSNLRKSVQI